MNSGFYGISGSTRLSSKAGAMEFAIMMNTNHDGENRVCIDYKEAKRLFDFICRNVGLPDVPHDPSDSLSEMYTSLLGLIAKGSGDKDSTPQES